MRASKHKNARKIPQANRPFHDAHISGIILKQSYSEKDFYLYGEIMPIFFELPHIAVPLKYLAIFMICQPFSFKYSSPAFSFKKPSRRWAKRLFHDYREENIRPKRHPAADVCQNKYKADGRALPPHQRKSPLPAHHGEPANQTSYPAIFFP